MRERLWCWIDNEQAVDAVEQDMPAGLKFFGHVVQPDDRGDVERAGHDCGMRGATAEIGRDAEDTLLVHGGCVRGREIMRDKNMGLGQAEKCLRGFPLQIVNDALGYILDV